MVRIKQNQIHLPLKVDKKPWFILGCLGCAPFVFSILAIVGLYLVAVYYGGVPEPQEAVNSQEAVIAPEIEEPEINPAGLEILDARVLTVTQTSVLTNEGPGDSSEIITYQALVQDIEPYQKVLSKTITPANFETVTDEQGNQYAKFEWYDLGIGEEIEIKAVYEVESAIIENDPGACQGETISSYLNPDIYIESDDPKIVELAITLSQDKANDCEKARAFYDWVGNNIIYTGYNPEDGGAVMALTDRGGDCKYFTDLFIALSRAGGIPARSIDGFTYSEVPLTLSDVKHAWAEVYLPGIGWTPVDPTWGRRKDDREEHFSQSDGYHIIVTRGRNLETLSNYHYLYYQYWWDGSLEANLTLEEDVQVLLNSGI